MPVAYGDAQVSVPASWYVLYDFRRAISGHPAGEVWVEPASWHLQLSSGDLSSPRDDGFGRPGIWIARINLPPPTGTGWSSTAFRSSMTPPASTYIVPSLGVEISVGGVLGQRVLRTLTRSPRSVALAPGPAPSIPPSWRSVTFAGLRFSVPGDWPINRTQFTPGLGDTCATLGVVLFGPRVTLSTDLRPFGIPICPYVQPTPRHPSVAVQVDSGLRHEPGLTSSFRARCLDLHGLTACPATSPDYSILVLRVTVPGRTRPVFVSIGLAGRGMIARTILYSLRAA